MQLVPHHVGIVVSDLARSKTFYTALGFEPSTEHVAEDKTISFLRLGDFQIELFAYAETPRMARETGKVLGFRHLALGTPDIDATFAELRAAGLLPEDAAIQELPSGWRLLFFDDPDGVEIEITQL